MLALDLPPEAERRLNELAAKSGRSSSAVAREAVLTYLEDLEDSELALEALKQPGERIPLKEAMRRYGVGEEV